LYSSNERDPRLQSLRGIAAMSVLISHCLWTFGSLQLNEPGFQLGLDTVLFAALRLLMQGTTAMFFFFVLSGYVLGQSLRRSKGSPLQVLAAFVVRRVFRIYPAMVFSVLFAALVLTAVSGTSISELSPPIAAVMKTTFTTPSLLSNLVGYQYDIDPPMWSIQVEIVLIAILPLLFAVSLRTNLLADLAITILLTAWTIWQWDHLPMPLRFVYFFQIGLVLPRLLEAPLAKRIIGSSAMMAASLLILIAIDWLFFRGTLSNSFLKHVIDAVISAQIIGFVLLRTDVSATKVLAARPLVWLGDISYSLYIYAMPVQFLATAFLLPPLLPANPSAWQYTVLTLLIVATTVALTIPLASASYYLIEKPGISMGRVLSNQGRAATVRVAPS
jgi:peptidoglycan/LPS O-acetylase OafA/YrhL